MDSYSGSEPRLFMSFPLGSETSGQPPQSSVGEERMETSDSFVTAVSVVEVSPNSMDSKRMLDDEETLAAQIEGQTAPLDNRKEDAPSNSSDKESGPNLQQDHPGHSDVNLGTSHIASNINLPTPREINVESSSTDESCSAYIARKWEQLGDVCEASSSGQQLVGAEKASTSAVLELTPNQEDLRNEEDDSNSIPEVTYLDSPKRPRKGNIRPTYGPPEAKIQKLRVKIAGESKAHSIPVPVTEGHLHSKGRTDTTDEFEMSEPEDTATLRPGWKPSSETDHESTGLSGSTVADAIFAPTHPTQFSVTDTASNTSTDVPEVPVRTAQLSGICSTSKLGFLSNYLSVTQP